MRDYTKELRLIAGLLAVIALVQCGGAVRQAVHEAMAQSTIQQVQICDPTASPRTCATIDAASSGLNVKTH